MLLCWHCARIVLLPLAWRRGRTGVVRNCTCIIVSLLLCTSDVQDFGGELQHADFSRSQKSTFAHGRTKSGELSPSTPPQQPNRLSAGLFMPDSTLASGVVIARRGVPASKELPGAAPSRNHPRRASLDPCIHLHRNLIPHRVVLATCRANRIGLRPGWRYLGRSIAGSFGQSWDDDVTWANSVKSGAVAM